MKTEAITPGLVDEVLDSQRVFKLVMNALARPGCVAEIDIVLVPPATLNIASAALLLTLCDHDTPVHMPGASDAAEWLRFHTDAHQASHLGEATFVVTDCTSLLPDLETFRLGTDTYPDRSATVIVQCTEIGKGSTLTLAGPGIENETDLSINPLPDWFPAVSSHNNAQFPRGLDWVFTANNRLVALPRTTRVTMAKGN